jgi:predicted DsbA family dithiol-disulfide isomerase
MSMADKAQIITVEIWSDIMCPFCYLGKRKFELALEEFPQRDRVRVTWKSFQLAPGLRTDLSVSIHEYLSNVKGIPIDHAKKLNEQVTEAGRAVGLEYDFNKVKVSNSFNAHRLLHLAKSEGKQNVLEEILFRAHFSEGQNLDDAETLVELGVKAGLEREQVNKVLYSDKYSDEVRADIKEAAGLAIRAVPFFIFDRRYALSGAQPPEVFLKALNAAANV